MSDQTGYTSLQTVDILFFISSASILVITFSTFSTFCHSLEYFDTQRLRSTTVAQMKKYSIQFIDAA